MGALAVHLVLVIAQTPVEGVVDVLDVRIRAAVDAEPDVPAIAEVAAQMDVPDVKAAAIPV